MPALSVVLSGQETAGFDQDVPFQISALPFQSTAAQNDAVSAGDGLEPVAGDVDLRRA